MKTVIKPGVAPRKSYSLSDLENGDEIRAWIDKVEPLLAPSPFDNNIPLITYSYTPGFEVNQHRFRIVCGGIRTIAWGAEDDKPDDEPYFDIRCALLHVCNIWNTRIDKNTDCGEPIHRIDDCVSFCNHK